MLVARSAATVATVAALTVGCATRALRMPSSNGGSGGASASTVLTAKELARMEGRGSLLDALARLRPFMLVSRGTTAPRVSVDGAPPGELAVLGTIPAAMVREVRLQRLSASVGQPAIGVNGEIVVGDIIVVTTWQGQRPDR